jgi:hypothetical protein
MYHKTQLNTGPINLPDIYHGAVCKDCSTASLNLGALKRGFPLELRTTVAIIRAAR